MVFKHSSHYCKIDILTSVMSNYSSSFFISDILKNDLDLIEYLKIFISLRIGYVWRLIKCELSFLIKYFLKLLSWAVVISEADLEGQLNSRRRRVINKALWRFINWMLCYSLSSMHFAVLLDPPLCISYLSSCFLLLMKNRNKTVNLRKSL